MKFNVGENHLFQIFRLLNIDNAESYLNMWATVAFQQIIITSIITFVCGSTM